MNSISPRLREGSDRDSSLKSSILFFIKSYKFFCTVLSKVLNFQEHINPKAFFSFIFQKIFFGSVGEMEGEVSILVIEVQGWDDAFGI